NKHQPKKGEPDLRGFEWRYLWSLSKGDKHVSFPAQDGAVRWIALSSSGDLMALGMDEKVNVWGVHASTLIQTLKRRVISGAFSRDARKLIVGTSQEVLVFDTTTWTETALPGENAGPIVISMDGKKIATATDGGVRVWSTADWSEESTLQG